MRPRWLSALGLAILISANLEAAAAQEPEGRLFASLYGQSESQSPLQVTDLLSLVRPVEVAISPDGLRVAYAYTPAEHANKTEENAPLERKEQIWVRPFDKSEPVLIGPPNANNSHVVWSPDGSKLAFYTGSGDQSFLAIWTVATSDVRITTVAVSPSNDAQWTRDGKYLLVSRSVAKAKSSAEKPSVTILTSGPNEYHLVGGDVVTPPGNGDGDHIDLLLANETTGATDTVASDIAPTRYELSPDGTKLFFTLYKGAVNSDLNWRNLFDVVVVNLHDKSAMIVARDILCISGSRSFAWSHDGRRIAFLGGNLRDDYHESAAVQKAWWPITWAYPVSCYIVDLQHPGVLRRIGYRQFYPFHLVWSKDDSAAYAISYDQASLIQISLASGTTRPIAHRQDERIGVLYGPDSTNRIYASASAMNGETLIRLIDLDDGSSRIVFHKFQDSGGLSVSRDGSRVAYMAQDISHPFDVWIADNHFAVTRQLTRLNPQIEGRAPSTVKSVSWQVNGVTFYGTVLFPSDYHPGQPYPMILSLYGGLRDGGSRRSQFGLAASGSLAYWSFPLLAARGYVVFIADSAMRRGTPMRDVADTVLPGVNKLVAMGIADPKRLGVFGWSWGGYSALSLITQTNRFKAAVSGSGISDLLTFYAALHSDGTDWTGFGESNQGHIGSTPWQYRQRYIENSPFFYLDRVRTPVLLEYGDADTTVDPFNSRETFVALRRLGKTATLVDYPGEFHSLSKLSNQIDFSKRMIDWFDYWLKGINPDGTPVMKPDQTKGAATDKSRSATGN